MNGHGNEHGNQDAGETINIDNLLLVTCCPWSLSILGTQKRS